MRSSGCFDLILHAVTTAFDDHRFSVVQKSVQHGAGQGAVIVEDFGPVLIGLVSRDDGRTGFIPLAEDLKEQIGACFIDWQISKLVDTNDAGAHVFLEFGFEAVGGLGRRRGQAIDWILTRCGGFFSKVFLLEKEPAPSSW